MKNAQKFANCIHAPLLNLDDEIKVISVFPPGELHELIGGVGFAMDLLIKMYGLEYVEKWTKSQGIIRHGYHSGGYDGNNSKRILERLDSLAAYLPLECAPIIVCLRAFKRVVHGSRSAISNTGIRL